MTAAPVTANPKPPTSTPTTSSGLTYLITALREMAELDCVEHEVEEANVVEDYCRQHCRALESREERTE
jgi:hypothetical protein